MASGNLSNPMREGRARRRPTLRAAARLLSAALLTSFAALMSCAVVGAEDEPEAGGSLPPAIAERTAAELEGLAVHNRGGLAIGTLAAVVRDDRGILIGVVRPADSGAAELLGAAYPLRDFVLLNDVLTAPTDVDAVMLDTERIWRGGDHVAVPRDVPLGKLSPAAPPPDARTAAAPARHAAPPAVPARRH